MQLLVDAFRQDQGAGDRGTAHDHWLALWHLVVHGAHQEVTRAELLDLPLRSPFGVQRSPFDLRPHPHSTAHWRWHLADAEGLRWLPQHPAGPPQAAGAHDLDPQADSVGSGHCTGGAGSAGSVGCPCGYSGGGFGGRDCGSRRRREGALLQGSREPIATHKRVVHQHICYDESELALGNGDDLLCAGNPQTDVRYLVARAKGIASKQLCHEGGYVREVHRPAAEAGRVSVPVLGNLREGGPVGAWQGGEPMDALGKFERADLPTAQRRVVAELGAQAHKPARVRRVRNLPARVRRVRNQPLRFLLRSPRLATTRPAILTVATREARPYVHAPRQGIRQRHSCACIPVGSRRSRP
mmetsp:Transcript_146113/g.407085  ORF Transcript_146113/g.407085 Transcript_146113/m.407085 type:complete len:355 (-) Transcript_146113:44-1108(-)